MLEQLKQVRTKAERELQAVADLPGLESWRLAYLGKKGELTQALRGVGKLPPDERPAVGLVANEIKAALEQAFEELKKVSDESVVMKEKALFWIYMVEWFTVMGTSVLTGFVLWTLMVRRRLYREVKVTRSGR